MQRYIFSLLIIWFLGGGVTLSAQERYVAVQDTTISLLALKYQLLQQSSQQQVSNHFNHRSHLAFFCKIESDLEKASRIPVKFRLGSVDYVDKLEKKKPFLLVNY